MTENHKKWFIRVAGVLIIAILAMVGFQRYGHDKGDGGVVSGNGRIEAVDIDVASKMPGRVKDILVREGEFVQAGQTVALMDTGTLEAQRRQAEAQLQQARSAIAAARSQLAQRESDKAAAQATLAQREAELNAARNHLTRSVALAAKGYVSTQVEDDAKSRVDGAEAAVGAARAQVAAAESAIASARSQVASAQSTAAAAQANIERIQTDIDDASLKAPRDGRVQYLVAHPGEVIAAGGRVLSMIDLGDMYMTFFLPATAAGRVALKDEVRLVLDMAPQYVIPAQISFVADEAQFTPKTVETASEREKLMFRVRAQLPADLLKKYMAQAKTGLPGVAYVRRDRNAAWPDRLQVKLPQ